MGNGSALQRRMATVLAVAVAVVAVTVSSARPSGAEPAEAPPLSSVASVAGRARDAIRGPSGNVWLAMDTSVVEVGADGELVQTIPVASARTLGVGPDGRVWFGGFAGSFGAIDDAGTVTTYTSPVAQASTEQIVSSGGFVWSVARPSAGTPVLLRWTTDGGVTQYPWTSGGSLHPTERRGPAVRRPLHGGHGQLGRRAVLELASLRRGRLRRSCRPPKAPRGSRRRISGWSGGTTTAPSPRSSGPARVRSRSGRPHRLSDGTAWFVGSKAGWFVGRLGETGTDATTFIEAVEAPSSILPPLLVESPTGGVSIVDRTSGDTAIWGLAAPSTLTSTTLSGPSSPPDYGDTVDLTATVTAWPGVTAPVAGTVDFLSEDGLLGSAPLVDGSATLSTPLLLDSNTYLWARFAGGDGLGGSSARLFKEVRSVATTIEVDLPAQPWRPGRPIDIGVNVTGGERRAHHRRRRVGGPRLLLDRRQHRGAPDRPVRGRHHPAVPHVHAERGPLDPRPSPSPRSPSRGNDRRRTT